jgi:hypothetical protein
MFASLWAISVGAGTFALTNYSVAAGEAAVAPVQWPPASSIKPNGQRFTLAMLVHPHCPCSRASLGELAKLMSRVGDHVEAHVFFIRPKNFEEEWERTDLWNSALQIPGVHAQVDPQGREAALLGAKTSGQVVLYSPEGTLKFSGGITPARSHMGDNQGATSIEAAVRNGAKSPTNSVVFGCELFDQEGT